MDVMCDLFKEEMSKSITYMMTFHEESMLRKTTQTIIRIQCHILFSFISSVLWIVDDNTQIKQEVLKNLSKDTFGWSQTTNIDTFLKLYG